MAENNMTYAEGSQILEAVKVLEALEASGEISPTEQSALDDSVTSESQHRTRGLRLSRRIAACRRVHL
mgnify:CR=1 FL=1